VRVRGRGRGRVRVRVRVRVRGRIRGRQERGMCASSTECGGGGVAVCLPLSRHMQV